MFIANLALSDTLLPLVGSLATPILSSANHIKEHEEKVTKCRIAMGLFVASYLHAFVALGIYFCTYMSAMNDSHLTYST